MKPIFQSAVLFPLCLLAGLLSLGCEKPDPIAQRMQEFEYTVDDLAGELELRLQSAKQNSRVKVGSRTERLSQQVASQEADRGGDGDRADPHSIDAIAGDTAMKLKQIAGDEDVTAIANQLVEKLSQQQGVPADALQSFKDRLLSAVSS